MKKYLDKFVAITLGCDKDGTILAQNLAAKKIIWLPKIGENFIHWSRISNLEEMQCQTHHLQKTNQDAETIKFQIIPYQQDKKVCYLVFIFLEDKFSKQITTAPPLENLSEEIWSSSKKKLSPKNHLFLLVSFILFFRNFQRYYFSIQCSI